MRIIAPMMILIMMTSTLAGCTGGDPDGGENDNIDMDVLNQLIDDNLQDFINNTTITVENHYHNNTTVVNNDNSVNNNSATGSDSNNLYLLDIEFNLLDLIPEIEIIDYRNNTFGYNWDYYDYATNSQRTDQFIFSCQVFYLVGANSTNQSNQVSVWEDSSPYYSAWENLYNSTIRDLLWDARYSNAIDVITGDSIASICNEDYIQDTAFHHLLIFEVPLPEGVALKGVVDEGYYNMEIGVHQYTWTNQCTYMQNASNPSSLYDYQGDFSWEEIYYPECDQIQSNQYLGNYARSFSVSFEYETIDWNYERGGWIGGSSDSELEIYVSNIEPDWQYRLIVYFEMANSVNNFE